MTLEKLLEKTKEDRNGCLNWLGHCDFRGYGQKRWQGKVWNAHRLSYFLAHGVLPKLDIDHLCRNRSCINPKHLEAVSHRENQLRGLGWAGKNSRKTHCPVGHEYSERNTYINPQGSRVCKTCAKTRYREHYLVVRH